MWVYLQPFLAALILALIATPVVRWVSNRYGWVSHPHPDRWSRRTTALFGGVAIFVSVMGAFLYFVPIENDKSLLGILVGSAVAMVESNLKRLLAYSSVAQIGYILLGASLISEAGITAAAAH
ncbi:MAG: proton-conducting transporter membrane subunit, partial [Nitrospinota bacterium]|nr:proton-conducting transporter membrane subunit [Nitrospinota bacterium]